MRSRYYRLLAWLACEKGQGLVEYALILVLVAIVVLTVLGVMGQRINAAFQDVVDKLGGG